MRSGAWVSVTACAATTSVLMMLSGCGDAEKRGYAIPDSLCGVAVQPRVLDQLLPPGKEIDQKVQEPVDSIQECNVTVDGEKVFSVRQERWEKGWSASRFARTQAYVTPRKEAQGGDQVYSASGAVAVLTCSADQGAEEDLYLVAKTHGQDEGDPAPMGKFITSYAQTVSKAGACDEL